MTRSTRIVVKRPADPLQSEIDLETARRLTALARRLPKPRTEESVRDELLGVARLVAIVEGARI